MILPLKGFAEAHVAGIIENIIAGWFTKTNTKDTVTLYKIGRHLLNTHTTSSVSDGLLLLLFNQIPRRAHNMFVVGL